MVGQENLIHTLQLMIDTDSLPHFIIFYGDFGQGKKVVANWVVTQLRKKNSNMQSYVLPDISVNSVRDMITIAYKQSRCIVSIYDVDKMSVVAKNSLLKVTEEIPNDVVIILTVQNIDTVLPTIRSRAVIFPLNAYSKQNLVEYCKGFIDDTEEIQYITDVAVNPGQVNILHATGVKDFVNYVIKVKDNIAKVSGANSFKIANKVALKENEDGYDIILFFQIFAQLCLKEIQELSDTDIDRKGQLKYAIESTETAISQSHIPSVNMSYIMDKWILEVRQAWM